MTDISNITYQVGCAVSEDVFYVGSTLDSYSENGFTRMVLLRDIGGHAEWTYHDLRFTVNSVCLKDKVNDSDRFVLALGEDGEIERFDGIESTEEYIPNSGLNAKWSDILGYVSIIRVINNDIFVGGSSGQVYMKIDGENWKDISITFDKNHEFLDRIEENTVFPDIFEIEIFDVNGFSKNELYAVGRLGSEGLIAYYNGEFWKILSKNTPADLLSILQVDNKNILICGAHGNLLLGNYEIGFKRLTSMGLTDDFYNATIFKDDIYIASNKYLYKYSNSIFTKVHIREDIDNSGFIKVESIGDVLWILTEKYIIKFNGKSWVFFDHPDNDEKNNGIKFNVKSGNRCPNSGYWFTVAKDNSRQYFKQGDIFPNVKSDWGDVYWQYDGGE